MKTQIFRVSYTQTGGLLDIKVAGAANYDRLTTSGTAALNGALSLSTINGYTPPVGTSFKIMTCGVCGGTFSSVSAGWTVEYNLSSVVAVFQGP